MTDVRAPQLFAARLWSPTPFVCLKQPPWCSSLEVYGLLFTHLLNWTPHSVTSCEVGWPFVLTTPIFQPQNRGQISATHLSQSPICSLSLIFYLQAFLDSESYRRHWHAHLTGTRKGNFNDLHRPWKKRQHCNLEIRIKKLQQSAALTEQPAGLSIPISPKSRPDLQQRTITEIHKSDTNHQ